MTRRSGQSRSPSRSSHRWRWALGLPLAIVLIGFGVYGYDYLTVNLWIERDAGSLENYPVRLMENQEEIADIAKRPLAELDRALIEAMRQNRRNVVTVSRSEIKYNLLRTRAYVKIFLETALPDNPDRRSRLRIICPLKHDGRRWQIAGPMTEKTIE